MSPQIQQFGRRQVRKIGHDFADNPGVGLLVMGLEIGAQVIGLVALALAVTDDDDLPAGRHSICDLLEELLIFRVGLVAVRIAHLALKMMEQVLRIVGGHAMGAVHGPIDLVDLGAGVIDDDDQAGWGRRGIGIQRRRRARRPARVRQT